MIRTPDFVARLLLLFSVFLHAGLYAANIELADIASGIGGFPLYGAEAQSQAGLAVAGLGDVNADGLDDYLIAAPYATVGESSWAGRSYVLFGGPASGPVDLADVPDGVLGYEILGFSEVDRAGLSASGAGDVNGDGYADVILSSPYADRNMNDAVGEVYVVFGKNDTEPVDLGNLESEGKGFIVSSEMPESILGLGVSGAGDVNGDDLDDILIGAPGAYSGAGAVLVVFGNEAPERLSLTDVAAGIGGFIIIGADTGDLAGWSVSGIGDMNQDGFNDILVGAAEATVNGMFAAGEAFVVFGKSTTEPVQLEEVLEDSGGFAITGFREFYYTGWSVSGAGDVNSDGIPDVVVGAPLARPNNISAAGEAYVVFGKTSTGHVNLSDVRLGLGGFVITGSTPVANVGGVISAAGDVNSDGFSDVLVSSEFEPPIPHSPRPAGTINLVYGKANGQPVSVSDVALGVGGYAIYGEDETDAAGRSVALVGDVNGDGRLDILVGAYGATVNGLESAGAAYIILGRSTDSSGGNCFIATAAYGTPMADELDSLRALRDEQLLTNPFGATFADAYYHLSPPLADTLARNDMLRIVSRTVLSPVVVFSRWLNGMNDPKSN